MPIISIIQDPSLIYPAQTTGNGGSNFPMEEVVARLLKPFSASSIPLSECIKPGAKVFILCNFVYHKRPTESQECFFAKCIHGSVLGALIEPVLRAVGPTGSVSFGNAPLQSCDWESVLRDTGAQEVLKHFQNQGKPVSAKDLRLFVAEFDHLGRILHTEMRDAQKLTRTITLRQESFLEELYKNGRIPQFRVLDYDFRKTATRHEMGRHEYVINREILDADVVISLVKMKTHEKVGITCGLKGFVGTVGSKDCLAHHRFGSPDIGGDEYPSPTPFRHWFSRLHDKVFSMPSGQPLKGAFEIFERTARRIFSKLGYLGGGAWYGNDTCWRMTLDLVRIAKYADQQGILRSTPQRKHFLLVDGIIGGEGEGPLAPAPRHSNTLIFSDDLAWGEPRSAAILMGFDFQKIPLIREAFQETPFPLTNPDSPVFIHLNGRSVSEKELKNSLSKPYLPPRGWVGHI